MRNTDFGFALKVNPIAKGYLNFPFKSLRIYFRFTSGSVLPDVMPLTCYSYIPI